ncbi:glutamate-rich protein 6B [Tiliqua scincoides]|uniref:glutamate-rich protein 6B n=1 Tax=Tiliqua scincoides TaxID=71010 RepID=UPI003463244A
MSDEQNQPEPGGIDQSQSESAQSPSEGQSVDPTPSSLLLTVENVKKLQEEYPTSKSALARWSIEAYMKQSSSLLNESGSSTDRSKDQKLSDEKAKAAEVHPPKPNTSEGYPEKSDVVSSKDFWTTSLPSSVSKVGSVKKRQVADLETQTEWSYSTSSLDASEKEKRKPSHEDMDGKEKSEEEEKEEIPSGSVEEEEGDETESESKEEAEMEVPTPSEMEDHSITDLCQLGCCEFCTSMLKPLPSPEELEEQPERVEGFLCCRTYKDIFHCVIQELMEQDSSGSEIDINPHPHLSQTVLESDTKKQLKQELEDRGFENYREVLRQYIKYGPCIKIAFRLKDHPPKPPQIVKKKRPRPEELLEIDLEFKAEQLKICHSTKTVKRYYPDGKIFYLLFPDGTGQVYYPSGNIAILITYVKAVQFSYIILSDSAQHEVQAFFTNQGYAAYYHQNGNLRMTLDLRSGSYFDRQKIQLKHWNWWDTGCHIHAPPFQPISIQLNVHIQVKVESQDQIFLTFTKLHDCLQLNVGARLKLKDQNKLQFLTMPEDEEESLSPSRILRIKSILANFHKLVKILCCTPSEHTQDLYLIVSDLCDFLQRRYKMKNPV